jgi:hypothetical protein
MSGRPRRARRPYALAGLLVIAGPLLVGFDLDRGELACEQAAAHLSTCCPDLVFPRWSCVQEGGCTRETDGTLIAEEESECLREESCDAIVGRQICERVEARARAVEDIDGPSIQSLYEQDWLCE